MSDTPTIGQRESELRHTLHEALKEQARLLATIREARAEARRESISASACRQQVPKERIEHWQKAIREAQTELEQVQGRIGAANQALRALPQRVKTLHTLTQLPRPEVRAPLESANNGSRPSHRFLELFHRVVCENSDPRLIEVWEREARARCG
jgi:chromosome segregation ATPase